MLAIVGMAMWSSFFMPKSVFDEKPIDIKKQECAPCVCDCKEPDPFTVYDLPDWGGVDEDDEDDEADEC